ncbi:hypothetical protein BCR42DRAFT_465387 [Absidia repens]|uniref:GAR domain-containing protein n=1 Tax=Absidia repens TaxID=90262 RepID=A0A1X2IIY6_9FUNG|nr:hypothetical protein BCR42DRAFT_465387 [Absidia repens]
MTDNNTNDTLLHLDTLTSIEQDIHTLLERQEELIYIDMVDMFDGIKKQLLEWMENAHLIIFTMEQKAKDGAIMSSTEVVPLQERMAKMESVMGYFTDISDSMDEKFDKIDDDTSTTLATKRMTVKMTMAKIQSEWSGLYHFMLSVTKQVETAYEKHELLVMMQNIMLDIDNLTSTIFLYQEKRHLALSTTTPIMTENGSGGDILSSNGDSLKDEALLSDLDQRVNPVFLAVEKVYARMNSTRPPGDDSGILVRKHRLVQEKWECLRIEIDELKDELKEDRWLAVFRQVADQVDTMINGLDKAVQECYNYIQQIFDWHDPAQQQHQSINNTGLSSPHSPSTLDKLSKTFLRSFPRNHHSSASITSSSSSASLTPPPFDREKFKSIEKNFEAKYTYYTPSIDRMLTMLGNGIASRTMKDSSTCERQSAMLSRWQKLKTAMDHLRMHDLMDAERCLVETPISPASSVQSDRSHHRMWRSIRRRPSEQESNNSADTNNSKIRASSITSGLPRMNQSTSQHEDYRRVRSVTPSSGTYHQSSKLYARQLQQQRTTSPLNFSSHPSPTHYNRVLRPSTSDTSSVDSGSASMRQTATGRKSLTPIRPAWNTSIKPDKPEFSSLEPLWKGESRVTTSGPAADTPSSARYQQRRKSHVPRPPSAQQNHTKEASFMKPTKSTMLRKRSQSVEPPDIVRPKTPTRTKGQSSNGGSNNMRRTKTPTTTTAKQLQYHLPPRPKSSLARQETHDMLPYIDRERNLYGGAKSPTRRSGTPSLIPRPKTPTDHQQGFLRSTSPSMVPRPRSSMRLYQQDGQTIPPVPPLPSNLERPSIHLLKVGILNKDDVYDDNKEHADDSTSPLSSSVLPDSFLSVPSLFDSNDASLLYHQPHQHRHQQQQQHYIQHQQHQNASSSISSSATQNSINSTRTNNDGARQPTTQERKRQLLKKRSMPALAIQRSGSPFQTSPATPTVRTTAAASPQPLATQARGQGRGRGRRRPGYYSEDEEDDEDDQGLLSPHSSNGTLQDHPIYTGDPRDPLDMEVATILNSSPIAMQCQKCPQGGGKYFFGNELNPTVGGGKKLYTCKLINYSGRPPRRQNGVTATASSLAANGASSLSMTTKNKVLIRVGGGWTELSQFLLDHALFL